jgi:hypothetical protein
VHTIFHRFYVRFVAGCSLLCHTTKFSILILPACLPAGRINSDAYKTIILMKKIFTLSCLMAVAGMAATASAQVVWGGRAGLCYSTATFSGSNNYDDYDDDDDDDNDNRHITGKAGLEAGPTLYYALRENIYLNSGAMFSIKNFKVGDGSLNLYYIEVPLSVGYAVPLGGLDFYAQAGPYVGIKLGERFTINNHEDSDDEDYGVGSFNAGVGLAGGINIKRFKIEVGYQYGLKNVLKEGDDNRITLGSVFTGVSYIF